MKIGIDLDGVVFDTESYYRAYADLFNYQNNKDFTPPVSLNTPNFFGALDPHETRAQKRYNWNEAIKQEFLKKYLIKIQSEAPLLPNAKQVLELLHQQGHELIVITRRGITTQDEIDITYKRCKQDNLYFDKYIFNQEDKVQACIEQKIDVMLEDYYDNVIELSKSGITCLYFRGGIQKFCNSEKVIEVDNWSQALIAIDFLAKNTH